MSAKLLPPGLCVGKYKVMSYIAAGGMGTVYRAFDRVLGRTVALKVLPAEVAQCRPLLARFRQEARHAAALCHPNIVMLFDYGHDAEHGLYFLALEFVDGINLFEYIEQQRQMRPEETRSTLLEVVKALDHANSHGIVHRDIKPANILLSQRNQEIAIKLTDLGLARCQQDPDFQVTREGKTVGTIDYMSPEQARDSASADIRSDIYALGCTAYHMLAGQAPFATGGVGERVNKHLYDPPLDVRHFNPAVSAALWAILQKMLAKNPDDRYATPRELLRALKSVSVGPLNDAANTVFEHGIYSNTDFTRGTQLPPPTVFTTPAGLPLPPSRRQSVPEPPKVSAAISRGDTAAIVRTRFSPIV